MASLYNLEPQPTAKAILHTTAGDLSLELFAKQTPLAARNFLQHCLDGYYDNTIFHRLVPGFIVQGGDPTGTGHGGISALNDGAGFEDEVHSRLKFNRRGLLGLAREEDGANGSQFFLTLGETRELQGRHTMFGRIEGDTIYNLMKMGEVELAEGEGNERPLYPTRITGAEVVVNPFEDMAARVKEAPRTSQAGQKEVKKRKKPAGKNVLSFGMDEEGEDGAIQVPAIKKVKANPKLVIVEDEVEQQEAPLKKKIQKARKEEPEHEALMPTGPVPTAPSPRLSKDNEMDDDDDDEDPNEARVKARAKARLNKTNAEIAALKASMKRTIDKAPPAKEKPKNALEAMIPATSTRGRKRGKVGDEKGVLDMFRAFKNRLEELPATSEPSSSNGHTHDAAADVSEPIAASTSEKPDDQDADEATLCDLHFIANCQSCKAWDTEADGEGAADGDVEDGAWMAHSLTFVKDTLGKDLEWKRKMAEIEVIDPREKARVIKEEAKRGRKERPSRGQARVR